jgi:hypothetical protein
MPADYILRLIEQVSLMLAELSRLKAGEKPARISALCLRETGCRWILSNIPRRK